MAEEREQLTLEQLQGIQTDPEVERRAAQTLELPEGGYNSVPELVLTLQKTGPDAKYPGRAYARFYGFFRGVGVLEEAIEGEERKEMNPQPSGKTGFNLSWEYRKRLDRNAAIVGGDTPNDPITVITKSERPDNMYKLWLQAKETYCKAVGLDKRAQVEVTAVLTFLQKYAVNVRFLRGDNSEIAVAISPAKQ